MIDPMSGMQLELDVTPGVATRPESTLLVERAAAYLKGGPASSQALVASVCRLSEVPPLIADHLAVTLLREHPRFLRTADGGWRLGEPAPPAWGAVPAHEPLLSSLSFAVVDVETTGGQPSGTDRITEIAIVLVRDGRVQEVYETLVNPERSIPPFVSRLTKITWEMVREKAPFRGICDDVLRALDGHVFVAHNAAFDWRFVSTEVARSTGRALTGRRLCTVRLARQILPQLRRRSLDWVAMHYGVEIPPGQRHRAGGDAVATARCLIRMLDDAKSHGCTTWSELERFVATGSAKSKKRRKKRRGLLAMPHSVTKDTTA
jgi:DNA polymerase-3 subunit epsilon